MVLTLHEMIADYGVRFVRLTGIKKQEVNVFTPPATNTQHPTTANPPQPAQRPQQNPQTAPAKPPEPTVECAICMDNVPMSSTVRVSEEPAAGPSNRPVGGCEHRYCRECMTQHVLVMVRDRKYPIGCPDPACEEMVVHDTVCALLKPHKADMEVRTHTHTRTHAHTHTHTRTCTQRHPKHLTARACIYRHNRRTST